MSIFSLAVYAQEETPISHVAINSDDWRDVYSGIMFANLNVYGSKFVLDEAHGELLVNVFPPGEKVFLIESDDNPFIINYKVSIENRGCEVEELISRDGKQTNLELAELLEDTKDFIVIDDSYGYNAVSVASYAYLIKAYVLFADAENIDDIVDFLDERDVDSLLIYGVVDREVRDALDTYSPEIMNVGSRFDNNIEIVKKFKQINDAEQVIFTNGEFIEAEIMSGGEGTEPVLFIGTGSVPEQVMDYVTGSNIKVGVVIGNDLSFSAKTLKDTAGLSVFLKFGQSGYGVGTGFDVPSILDMFYLPTYETDMTITSITYNTATKKLEVIYENTGDIPAYFMSSIGILVDGEKKITIGDEEPLFIMEEEQFGVAYDVDLTDEIAENKALQADIFTKFGESDRSMDKAIEGLFDILVVSVTDECDITATGISYNKRIQRFIITMKNTGDVSCYADPYLVDLIINDEATTLGYEDVEFFEIGEKKELKIKQRMDTVDIEDNEEVHLRTFMGERENLLLTVKDDTFKLKIVLGYIWWILLAILLLLLLIVVLYIIWRRRRRRRY